MSPSMLDDSRLCRPTVGAEHAQIRNSDRRISSIGPVASGVDWDQSRSATALQPAGFLFPPKSPAAVQKGHSIAGSPCGTDFGGGAACVTRTRDPRITNAMLYRLS
jgi:hypothetical protein